MPSDNKAHGTSSNHGHGHKRGRGVEPISRRQGKSQVTAAKDNKGKTKEKRKDNISAQDERDAAVMQTGEETVYVPYDKAEENGVEDGRKEEDKNEKEHDQEKEQIPQEPEQPTVEAKKEYKRSNVTPENFNVREFNTNMTEFVRTLEDPRYSQMDAGYPVEELVSVVGMVTTSVNDYRKHTSATQHQLEDLRDTMKTIKENLHFSITRQAMDLRVDEEHQSQEEKELHAKLTELNAAIAQANADVTEALRLATDTESTAVRANIAAERAREEARRIKEEAEKKEKAEQRRKEEEKRRMEEQKREKEAEEKRIAEEKQRMEEEWKRMEAIQAGKTGHVYDTWQPAEYEYTNETGETEVACIARGQPGSFDKNHVTCKVANEKEALVTYPPNEELISNVVDLSSTNGEEELKDPIYVAIPHVLSRGGAQSREPVVKAMVQGEWQDLPTRDVTFDAHKDTKFAQAEVRHLTTLIVMARFKRDYVTLDHNKSHKLTSSFDQRITLTIDKDTFGQTEHFLLQVQPVDSATVQEFRTRQANGKGLLTSSPIVYCQWEHTSLRKPIQVTLSCPPNPAKAKKMALARKLKEERMKNPPKPPAPIDEVEKEKEKERERERKRMQELQEMLEGEEGPVKVTKWYMGEYGNTDDDETDRLHFVYMHGGKWFVEPDMVIKQVKVDVLTFQLELAVERFMVVRTRTSVDESGVMPLVISLNDFLAKRFVETVVRQKTDNPFEVALQVTPVSRREAVVKQLAQNGFESGPAPSHVICLREGDIIEVSFSGNIECLDDVPSQLIYKSNIPTMTYFTVKEENRFRQKEQDVYSGLILLTRRYPVTLSKARKLQSQGQHAGQGHEEGDQQPQQPQIEWKTERLCALQLNIPKYHIEPNTEPKKAPVVIPQRAGPVDSDLLMNVAESLGEEWKKVAHYLGVHRARVQAIKRNVTVGERSEREAKYDMLVTWLKGAAKALDKVSALSSALAHSDRYDLAEMVEEKGRQLEEMRRGHTTAVH